MLYFTGVNAAEYNASGDIPGNLCALCAGNGTDKCSPDENKNKYVSHEGAFKCMADGAGDVAFFKHGTVEKVLKKYPIYGNLTDYAYLCKDGTRNGRVRNLCCMFFFFKTEGEFVVGPQPDHTQIPWCPVAWRGQRPVS